MPIFRVFDNATYNLGEDEAGKPGWIILYHSGYVITSGNFKFSLNGDSCGKPNAATSPSRRFYRRNFVNLRTRRRGDAVVSFVKLCWGSLMSTS